VLEFAHDAPVVLLSPHFDDAVLGCWTLLAEREPDLIIVNVFAGAPEKGVRGDWDRRVGLSRLDLLRGRDSAWLVRRRAAEDRDALAALGRRAVNLNQLDAQYRRHPAHGLPDSPPAEIMVELVQAVPRASAVLLPAAIAPTLAETHRDHLLLRSLWVSLAAFGGRVGLYADLPYAARAGWPGWVTGDAGSAEAAAAWERALAEAGLRLERLTPDVRKLSPDEQERKRTALGRYRTQWKSLETLEDELRFEVILSLGEPG
jgi:LmbE family N-acetylglucosaminyl deacetylase